MLIKNYTRLKDLFIREKQRIMAPPIIFVHMLHLANGRSKPHSQTKPHSQPIQPTTSFC